ncbi:MAG: DUF4345 family protein [Amylibacter sp.]|nr:DUF4345 family protein [Amylibacter sp.]
MAFHLLRILLFITSFLIVGVGLSFFVLGPNTTFTLLLELSKPLLNSPAPITDMAAPNVDGEIRTLAPFLIAYGVLVFLEAKHLRTHLYYVPHLLAVFFAAGIGRVLSYFIAGAPHPLFSYILLSAELGAPILLFLVYKLTLRSLAKG